MQPLHCLVLRPLLLLTIAGALGGCGSSSSRPEDSTIQVAAREPAWDFSGSWEVDLAASDSVRRQIMANLRQRQRDMERRARNGGSGSPLTLSLGGRRFDDVLALTDMAEIVTEPTLLEVLQDDAGVRIRRENSFALVCDFTETPPVVTATPFGNEACTWDGRTVMFRIDLPAGLLIEHELRLAPDKSSMAVTTQLYSSRVAEPVQVRKVYRRYDPEAQGFRCTETISRGRVCTTASKEPPP